MKLWVCCISLCLLNICVSETFAQVTFERPVMLGKALRLTNDISATAWSPLVVNPVVDRIQFDKSGDSGIQGMGMVPYLTVDASIFPASASGSFIKRSLVSINEGASSKMLVDWLDFSGESHSFVIGELGAGEPTSGAEVVESVDYRGQYEFRVEYDYRGDFSRRAIVYTDFELKVDSTNGYWLVPGAEIYRYVGGSYIRCTYVGFGWIVDSHMLKANAVGSKPPVNKFYFVPGTDLDIKERGESIHTKGAGLRSIHKTKYSFENLAVDQPNKNDWLMDIDVKFQTVTKGADFIPPKVIGN